MSTIAALLVMAALFALYGAITLWRGAPGAGRCGTCPGQCGVCDRPEYLEEHSHGSS